MHSQIVEQYRQTHFTPDDWRWTLYAPTKWRTAIAQKRYTLQKQGVVIEPGDVVAVSKDPINLTSRLVTMLAADAMMPASIPSTDFTAHFKYGDQ